MRLLTVLHVNDIMFHLIGLVFQFTSKWWMWYFSFINYIVDRKYLVNAALVPMTNQLWYQIQIFSWTLAYIWTADCSFRSSQLLSVHFQHIFYLLTEKLSFAIHFMNTCLHFKTMWAWRQKTCPSVCISLATTCTALMCVCVCNCQLRGCLLPNRQRRVIFSVWQILAIDNHNQGLQWCPRTSLAGFFSKLAGYFTSFWKAICVFL